MNFSLKDSQNSFNSVAYAIRNTDVQIPSVAYWKKVRNICNRYNVLLILDEIPIAFGRTGKMFAFEHWGIIPDVLLLGKALGAGMPIGAFVTSKKLMHVFTDNPILWLKDPQYMMMVIIVVQLWLSLGVSFLAFIAGLQSVDKTLYEAGAIDGIRNRWQELWFITLPTMKPHITTFFIAPYPISLPIVN